MKEHYDAIGSYSQRKNVASNATALAAKTHRYNRIRKLELAARSVAFIRSCLGPLDKAVPSYRASA